MAKYDITAPDGSVFEVTAPDDASEADVLAYAQANYQAAKPLAKKRDSVTSYVPSDDEIGDLDALPTELYRPKSVMDDVPAGAGRGTSLIEERGAPVEEKIFAELKRQYDLASPEQRAQMTAQPGVQGNVFRAIGDSYRAQDTGTKGIPTAQKLTTRVEDRRAVRASQGYGPDAAQAEALQDVQTGNAPGAAGIGVSDLDFAARNAAGPKRVWNDWESGLVGSTGATLAYAGRKSGIDTLTEIGDSMSNWADGKMPNNPTFADKVVSGFGSSASFLLPGMGVMKGTEALAVLSQVGAKWLGAGTMAALEAAAEADGAYKQLLASGASEDRANQQADTVFWQNMALLGVSDKVAFFNDLKRAKTALGRGAQQFAVAAPTEASQEFGQQVISNDATGRPLFEGAGEAAAIGAIVGGGSAAVKGALEQPSAPRPTDILSQPTTDQAIQTFNATVDSLDSGEGAALTNELAKAHAARDAANQQMLDQNAAAMAAEAALDTPTAAQPMSAFLDTRNAATIAATPSTEQSIAALEQQAAALPPALPSPDSVSPTGALVANEQGVVGQQTYAQQQAADAALTSQKERTTTTLPDRRALHLERNPSGTFVLTGNQAIQQNVDQVKETFKQFGLTAAKVKDTESGITLQVGKSSNEVDVRSAVEAVNARFSANRTAAEITEQEALLNQNFPDEGEASGPQAEKTVKAAPRRNEKEESPHSFSLDADRPNITSNRFVAGAKKLSDLAAVISTSNKGFNALSIEDLARVKNAMIRVAKNHKVLDSVVKLIPIDVVNMLRSKKLTPEMLFNNPSMFEYRGVIGNGNPSVPVDVNAAAALIKAMADVATKIASTIDASEVVRRPIDAAATLGTENNAPIGSARAATRNTAELSSGGGSVVGNSEKNSAVAASDFYRVGNVLTSSALDGGTTNTAKIFFSDFARVLEDFFPTSGASDGRHVLAPKNNNSIVPQVQPQAPRQTLSLGRADDAVKSLLQGKISSDAQVGVIDDIDALPDQASANASINPQTGVGRMSRWTAKAIRGIASMLGRQVVFYETTSDSASEGINRDGKTLYVNIDSGIDALRVAGHEFTHSLEYEQPKLYAKMLEATKAILRADPKRGEKYAAYAGVKGEDSVARELLSDIGGNEWGDQQFWTDVFAEVHKNHAPTEARSLIGRIRDAVVAFINKLIKATPKSGFKHGYSREELTTIRDMIVSSAAKSIANEEMRRMGIEPAQETGAPAGVVREAPARPIEGTEAEKIRLLGFTVRGGEVSGAPPFIQTLKDIKAQIKQAVNDALSDQAHPEDAVWYREAGRAIREYSHGNKVLMEKLTRIVAKLSQGAGVNSNVTSVIKAAYQIANGETPAVGRFPNAFREDFGPLVSAAVFDDTLKGVNTKLQNFYRNLHDEVFRKNDWPNAVVIDRHAINYIWHQPGKDSVASDAQYAYAERIIQLATKDYNKKMGTAWKPRDMQAVLWGHWKRREEGTKTEDAAHGGAWNYPQFFERATANVTAEVLPSTQVSDLDTRLTPTQKREFQKAALDLIFTDGQNELAERSGLVLYKEGESTGGYEDKINPNLVTGAIAQKVAKESGSSDTYHRYLYDAVDRYALGWQYIFRQDGVPWFRADKTLDPAKLDKARAARDKRIAAGKKVAEGNAPPMMSQGFHIKFGKNLTDAEEAVMFKSLQIGVHANVGFTRLTPDSIAVINYRDESGKPFLMSDEDFKTAIGEVELMDATDLVPFAAESRYHYYDFGNDKTGEAILGNEALQSGQRDLQDWLRGRREAFDALVSEWEGRVRESKPRPSDEGSDGHAGERTQGQGRPSYGEGIEGSISVTGVHYSTEPREQLDSAFYGRGLKGAERPRVMAAKDARLRQRVYFYINTGNGTPAEAGVGSVAHTVDLRNLYDMDADQRGLMPEGLMNDNDRMNGFESNVIDAGYDGYMTRNFGNRGAAVLIGKHNVSVMQEATPDTGTAGKVSLSGWKDQQQKVMENRALPSGQMTGADWKRLMPKLMPDVDVSHLDDAQSYYKDQLVQRSTPAEDIRHSNRRNWYYSQLESSVAAIPAKLKTGNEIALWLQANAGKLQVKQDELQWSGVLDFLRLKRPTATLDNDAIPLKNFSDAASSYAELASYFVARDSAKIQFNGDVQRPSDSAPPINPILIERVSVDPDSLDDIRKIASGSLHSFSALHVPAKRLVVDAMRSAIHDDKIAKTVVELIPVNVMNDFRSRQLPSNVGLDDVSVLKNSFSINPDAAIPSLVDIAVSSSIAGRAFDIAEAIYSGLNATGKFINLSATISANDNGHVSKDGKLIPYHSNSQHITKEEILAFLQENGVRVVDKMLDENDVVTNTEIEDGADIKGYHVVQDDDGSWSIFDVDSRRVMVERLSDRWSVADWINAKTESNQTPKYGEYTLPGGENYKELLITLPTVENKAYRPDVVEGEPTDKGPTFNVIGRNGEVLSSHRTWAQAMDESYRIWQDAQIKLVKDNQVFRSSHFDTPNILAHVRFNERTDAEGRRVLFIEELQSDWNDKVPKKGKTTPTIYKADLDLDKHQWFVHPEGRPESRQYVESADQAQRLARRATAETHKTAPAAPFVMDDSYISLALKRAVAYAVDNGFDVVAWTSGQQQYERFPTDNNGESTEKGMKTAYDIKMPSAVKKLGIEIGTIAFDKTEQQARWDREGAEYSAVAEQPGFVIPEKIKQQVQTTGMPLFSLRRARDGDFSSSDYIVPEMEPWQSNSQLVDLAYVDGKPIRLTIGGDTGKGEGKGALHIIANAARDTRRTLDQVTDDEGENAVRTVLKTLTSYGAVLHKDKRNEFALRLPLAKKTLILTDRGDHYQIITLRNGAENKWGDADWTGRLTFPATEPAVGSEPTSSSTLENPLGGEYGQGSYVSAKWNATPPKIGSQKFAVRVTVKKKRTIVRESKPRLIGDSGRQYTPEQEALHQNVGRVFDEKSIVERGKEYFSKRWKQGIFDQFHPFREIDKVAYALMRLSKGATGGFEAFMKHGKLKLVDGVYDADTSGGALKDVFIPLGREVTDFLYWIAGNRAERLAAEGKERLFTPADIAAAKSLSNGTTEFDYVLSNGNTTRDRTLIYADALKKFNEYNKNVMDMAEQSGLIDGASRKLWEHEFYVPFYRVMEDDNLRAMGIKKGLVRQEAFKRLKGGDKPLGDLLENTLLNWHHLIDASAKNRAAKAAVEAAERVGAARKAVPGETKTVWFMDGGQKIEYKIDDTSILEAVNGLQYAGLRGPLWSVLTAPKHWLTVGVTASPFFKVRNLIRDSMQAIATSDLSYNLPGNVLEGYRLTNRDRQEYVSALASGGLIRFGTMLEGSEAARARQLVKQGSKDAHLLDNEGALRKFWDKTGEPMLTWYNELGNRGEEINRMALFQQLVDKGATRAEAALAARDLMDFSLQGGFETVRILAQVVPFFNARLQGLYKLGRASKENREHMAIVAFTAAVAGLAMMAYAASDDDRWKRWKKREEWDKASYWYLSIGDMEFRIPRPFELGAVAHVAERTVEAMFDKERDAGKRLGKALLASAQNQLAMNPVPQALKPIVDLYANKDSFTGRPIETMGMERLDPQHRFTSSTSMPARWAADWLSPALNKGTLGLIPELSPVQYDHLVRAYFGWMGAMSVGTADMFARSVNKEPTRPALDYWKLATGGMVQDDPVGSRYISMMYDQAAELEQAHATYNKLRKEGKLDEANEYREDNKEKLIAYRSVESVKKQVSKLNERIRMIERSDKHPAEKRILIRELKQRESDLAARLSQ